MSETITLFLVDDQALVRGAMSALLSMEEGFRIVGEVASIGQLRERIGDAKPAVCLMDIQLGDGDGIDALAVVQSLSPDTRVLMVTTFARPGYVRSALERGASGFVVKDATPEQLAAAIRKVHAGLRAVDPTLLEASLFDGENPLSEREQQVLRLAASGIAAQAIAAQVFLSAGTVRNLLSSAITKVGGDNRAQAAQVALEKGWI